MPSFCSKQTAGKTVALQKQLNDNDNNNKPEPHRSKCKLVSNKTVKLLNRKRIEKPTEILIQQQKQLDEQTF